MAHQSPDAVELDILIGKPAEAIELVDCETTEDPHGGSPAHRKTPELDCLQEPEKPTASALPVASPYAVGLGIALYAICSSTLLVINKVAMHLLPDAAFVLFCQFLASTLAVRCLRCARPDMDIELITWEKVKPFAVATLAFYLCLFTNTQALQYVNVETVIVARSCSPIAVALLDHVALGRDLPTLQGGVALLSIAGGSSVYVLADKGFRIDGYLWLAAYFVFIVVEMVFVKFVVDTVPMSTWTRVYYNNVLSLPMAVLSAFAVGGSAALSATFSPKVVITLGLACVVGVAISYAGFNLRKLVSATSFTVVGVVCKIITVLINDLIWTQHSSAIGHFGLLICIAAGFMYEQVKVQGGKS